MKLKIIFALLVLAFSSCTVAQGEPGYKLIKNLDQEFNLVFFSSEDPKIKNWKKEENSAIAQLIIKEYGLPDDVRVNLYVHSALDTGVANLIYFGMDWRASGKDSREAFLHKKIIEKNCLRLKENFPGSCGHRDALRVVAYGLYDYINNRIIPLPDSWKMGSGKPAIFAGDNYDQSRIDQLRKMNFDMRLYGGAFKEANYGLRPGQSRECLSGKFGLSDFNGDGKNELFVFSGEMDDDLYVAQVEEKKFGLTRVRVAIIDFLSGEAVPLLAQELFSYEMKYKEDVGHGLYRDTKIYWGDYNSDKKYDYIIRTRQARLDYFPTASGSNFLEKDFEEDATLFLGVGLNKYSTHEFSNNEDFKKYLLEKTEWSKGFPSFAECNM